MEIFIGGLFTETNTRSTRPTTLSDFEAGALHWEDASLHARIAQAEPLRIWRAQAQSDGFGIVDGPFAYATPGGRIEAELYRRLRDALVAASASAGPVDVMLLHLHGAMAAEGIDDCEGDILARLREVAPEAFIAVEIDLHAHLSPAMLSLADLIIAYKHYPHTDVGDRARDLYRIAIAARRGQVQPVMASFDCRMIHIWRTLDPEMREFVERLEAMEGRGGIMSVSFIHGFAHADVADVGARMLVVADGDADEAARLAERLGRDIFALTPTLPELSLPMDAALDRALASESTPVVVADVSDNPGGGAPGDSTFLLRALIDRGVENAAIGYFHDPQAVEMCRAAGVGAVLDLSLGGHGGSASGDPVRMRAQVMALSDGHEQTAQTGAPSPLGAAAWIRMPGRLDIVATTRRQQVLGPDGFERLGVLLSEKRLIVVKSAQHFRRNFDPIAGLVVYADSPGACTLQIGNLRFEKRDMPYWPKDENPFIQP